MTQDEGKWEEEQRGESDMEKEEECQEDSSIEEGDGERKCSFCDTGVSVFECEDCHIPLHESCSSSLTPFLCDFCMRKKRLREQECKTDATSDREESEEEGDGRDILEIYSASTSISDEQPEEEYTTKERLEVEPFLIGGQNSSATGSKRVLQRKTEASRDITMGQISPTQTQPNKRTLRSEVKKEAKK